MAEQLVAGVRAAGGIWSVKDLAEYRVIERKPVRGRYLGFEIISAAPPSSGGIALVTMLNILAGYDLTALQLCTYAVTSALAGEVVHPERPSSGGPGAEAVAAAAQMHALD